MFLAPAARCRRNGSACRAFGTRERSWGERRRPSQHSLGADMSEFLDRIAFSIGSDRYHWADVVAAAVAWGRWRELVAESKLAASLERAARAAGTLPARAELA